MNWSDPAVLMQGLIVAAMSVLFFMGVDYGSRHG